MKRQTTWFVECPDAAFNKMVAEQFQLPEENYHSQRPCADEKRRDLVECSLATVRQIVANHNILRYRVTVFSQQGQHALPKECTFLFVKKKK